MKIRTKSCGTATIRAGERGLEVLLVQPRAGQDKWAFPKGHMDLGEIEEDTAVRETLEETGVEVTLLPEVLGTFDVKFKHEHKTVVIYMAQPTNLEACEPAPKDGENHDVRWWPLDGLPQPIQSQEAVFALLHDTVRRTFEA